jgi:hypothetical protein
MSPMGQFELKNSVRANSGFLQQETVVGVETIVRRLVAIGLDVEVGLSQHAVRDDEHDARAVWQDDDLRVRLPLPFRSALLA